MRCLQCQHENSETAKFCEECGTKLARVCPSCGQEMGARAKFCSECGASLSEQSPASSPPASQPPLSYTPKHLAERILAERDAMAARGMPDGERKTITALFADLKGSTALIEGLDPEEARALIDPALHLMMTTVHQYEGYVAQSLGDGIFALFGAPLAHEDHAQRALYAALRMQDEMKRYSDTLRQAGSVPLSLRVGINTGEVVVRSIRTDDLHVDYVPVGHSTNIAARMEQLATPGTIVVSESTHRLTQGYFEFKALGATHIKGLSAPLPLYEVVGVGPLRTRFQVAARRGLARFVGRQSELEHLERARQLVLAGHGQILGVVGEPGVGKSRLLHEFKVLHQQGCLVLETFSVAHGKAYAYFPLIELLKNYFQLSLRDEERKRQEKVGGKVLMLDRTLEDTLPYLFFLLGIVEPSSPLQQMDAQVRRRRVFEAIKRLLVRESLKQPLILIFEDLHWLDSETQAFLQFLSESVATTRILLLVNYRPEYQHEWGSKTYYTQLRLDPLRQAEAEEFLTTLFAERVTEAALSQDLKRLILAKTEGNPFFMEEIVQELIEQGVLTHEVPTRAPVPRASDLRIPPTVQGILAARIDRLSSDEKALLQTLAVVGKQFSWSLLKQVTEQTEEGLHRLLSTLQAKEFIYEQPAVPEIDYVFKHALTQEVAYNTVLRERRKTLHERAAQGIEILYGHRLSDHYGDLAHHYGRSGNTQKAIEYLQCAGQQAAQRSGYAEAIVHFTAALELVPTLPETPERTQREVALQLALGAPIMATKGFAAAEAGSAYRRARELCQQMKNSSQLLPALHGLYRFSVLRAELQTAREFSEEMLHLAENSQDPALLLEAHRALGSTLYPLGQFSLARSHLEQAITLHDPQQHTASALQYGLDVGVVGRSHLARVLWHLGYPDQARQRNNEALALAQELAHPFSLAFALRFAATFSQFRREEHAAQELAEAALCLAREHGFTLISANSQILQGWARAMRGQTEGGIQQIREGLAAYRTTGAELEQPYFLALLAEAYEKTTRTEEGLHVLAEALARAQKTGEQQYEPELYRLKGALLLAQEGKKGTGKGEREKRVAAEECFRKAIALARQQQAKSWELRATISVAQLWQQQGKKKEARQMLAEIYGWFTEGFDTKDSQEAQALLEALRQ